MNKSKLILTVIVLSLISFSLIAFLKNRNSYYFKLPVIDKLAQDQEIGGLDKLTPHPLSIEALKKGEYPGSDLTIEQTLSSGSNYKRYIASYKSEGLKIFGLLTVPIGEEPEDGWPAIIFNHGYIPPAQYRTTERYSAYTDGFSRAGYVLFRPDYRGHGNSEGEASGAYGSNDYTIDVLNAFYSVKNLPYVNREKIGMWGHSLGGFVTLRSMVVSKDIKAGVIWAGVVGSYEDLFSRWRRRNIPSTTPGSRGGSWRQQLSREYGEPDKNPEFWHSLSANYFLADISGPLQLHHGTADNSVPLEFSEKLVQQMKNIGKEADLFTYSGDDHNLSAYFNSAMQRSVEFFNKYLKGGETNL